MAVSQISVGLAEIKIAKDEGNLIAFGLGSCIGLIGAKNIAAVEKQMKLLLARPLAVEVGGNVGRTFSLDVATGDVMIKTVQGGATKLTNLRAA